MSKSGITEVPAADLPGRIALAEQSVLSAHTDIGEVRSEMRDGFNKMSRAVEALTEKLSDRGKMNWAAFASMFALVVAFLAIWGKPMETNIATLSEGQRRQDADHRTEMIRMDERHQADMQREQAEILRNRLELDTSAQREMRQLVETVNASAAATKEMILGRMTIDEKRLDDVTNRVDRANEEAVKAGNAAKDYLLLKDKGTVPK